MKVLALDIETTGLDPDYDKILEVGAIYADVTAAGVVTLGTFRRILLHNEIHGSPKILAMHANLIREIEETRQMVVRRAKPWGADLVCSEELAGLFLDWLRGFLPKDEAMSFGTPEFTLIGKDILCFDVPFLSKLKGWHSCFFHRRILDVGSLWVQETDTEVPDLKECLRRSGVDKEIAHTALEDCRDSLRCLAAHFAR